MSSEELVYKFCDKETVILKEALGYSLINGIQKEDGGLLSLV
jgi:hypothetical protein